MIERGTRVVVNDRYLIDMERGETGTVIGFDGKYYLVVLDIGDFSGEHNFYYEHELDILSTPSSETV